MTTKISGEELTSTRAERLLAGVLAIFAAIGCLWIYSKMDNVGRPVYPSDGLELSDAGRSDPAIKANADAQERAAAARSREGDARERLVLAREEYRTALDAGRTAANLERPYQGAQEAFKGAQRSVATAVRKVAATQPAADAASKRISRAQAKAADEFAVRTDHHRLGVFLGRLAFCLGLLAASFWLFRRLGRTHSRRVPLAGAAIATAIITSIVFATDYTTDYVNPLETGPLVLSLVGIVATLAAFMGLQRQVARRVPARRVRKHECPYCGFPIGAGAHCEGCGRDVNANCASCDSSRRVGAPFCATCGAP